MAGIKKLVKATLFSQKFLLCPEWGMIVIFGLKIDIFYIFCKAFH